MSTWGSHYERIKAFEAQMRIGLTWPWSPHFGKKSFPGMRQRPMRRPVASTVRRSKLTGPPAL